MMPPNQTPAFNLKAVVRETGLKPDTLRAWERRYGLPQPQRTPGGHRLYSQQDIDTLKWLVARQKEGLSISRAIDRWRQLEAEGQDPLQAAPALLDVVSPVQAGGETMAELRQAWISACLAFDERQAEHVLAQAFACYSPETVCFEVLQKGLVHIGQGWYQGTVTVQQEHFTSALASRRLEALIAAAPGPIRPGRILVGCPPGESHTFSPLLLTLLLRRRGWDVLYLGANVPISRLENTVAMVKPQLIILSAQLLPTAATLLEMTQALQQEQLPVGFGGRIFNHLPALRNRIPGQFLGERLDLVPQVAEQLLTSPRPAPAVETVSEEYRQALVHYRRHQAEIEAEVWRVVSSGDITGDHLSIANDNLARNIMAALNLGSLDFLGADITWVEGLLANYRLPVELLQGYLQAYHQALRTHLDDRGSPILSWMARLTANSE